MPGYHCDVYAWPGILPQELWTAEIKLFHDQPHPMVAGGWRGNGSCVVPLPMDRSAIRGIFFLQSTPAQELRFYSVFFIPLCQQAAPMMREMGSAYMRVLVLQIPLLLLMNDRPCFYLGALHHLGHLFGLDLTGAVINRSGQPLPLRAPMPRMLQHNTEEASAELFGAFMDGMEAPHSMPVHFWWQANTLAIDVIAPGDYFCLSFMRDYGTGRGPCIALYATSRLLARRPGSIGCFHKWELYDVPHSDPSHWYLHRGLSYVGLHKMFDWAVPGDLAARL